MGLDAAISLLQAEVERSTARIQQPGDTNWHVSRAKSFGLSLLKTLKQKGLDDPQAADQFRKDLRTDLVTIPDA